MKKVSMPDNSVKLTQEVLTDFIWKLVQWEALEIEEVDGELLIPYLMNDGVECYLKLTGALMLGPEPDATVQITPVEHQDQKGLVLHQNSGNIITIWYKEALLCRYCYQYHMIGHCWRKKPGEEQIRRLVNLICVLHDKRTYLGEEYCEEEEVFLADLAEFPPVLYFTPINESILDWYPDSLKGIEAAEKIASLCQDISLEKEIQNYKNSYQKQKVGEKQTRKLAYVLLMEEHACFWKKIREWMEDASMRLPVRDYGEEGNQKREAARQSMVESYRIRGFEGDFPYMKKQEREVFFFEEQPFTVLEEEDYEYKVIAVELRRVLSEI